MKILKIEFKNYKSVKQASLDFQENDKIVIIGKNASGKTHVLEAINYIFNVFNHELNDFINCVDNKKTFEFEMKVNLNKSDLKILNIDREPNDSEILVFSKKNIKAGSKSQYILNDTKIKKNIFFKIIN